MRPAGAGVDLFFMISGFTMIYASQRAFGSSESVFPFLARRFIRIFPAYWLATALILTLIDTPDMWTIVTSVFLIPTGGFPIIAPGWTLIYEVCFYCVFAAWIWLPMRRAAAAIIATLLLLVVVGSYVPSLRGYCGPLILEFAVGVIFGVAYCRGMRIGPVTAKRLLAAGLVVYAATFFLKHEFAPDLWARQVVWGLPMAVILAAILFGPEIPILKHGAIQFLGDASYSIYVTHWVVLRGFLPNPHHKVAIFVVSIFLGIGVHYALERPFLAYAKSRIKAWRLWRGKGSATPAVAGRLPA